jgi:hypothetical protein
MAASAANIMPATVRYINSPKPNHDPVPPQCRIRPENPFPAKVYRPDVTEMNLLAASSRTGLRSPLQQPEFTTGPCRPVFLPPRDLGRRFMAVQCGHDTCSGIRNRPYHLNFTVINISKPDSIEAKPACFATIDVTHWTQKIAATFAIRQRYAATSI